MTESLESGGVVVRFARTAAGVKTSECRPESKLVRPKPTAIGTGIMGNPLIGLGCERDIGWNNALAGFTQADKPAQPASGNGRIPGQPETAYTADRYIAGVATRHSEAVSFRDHPAAKTCAIIVLALVAWSPLALFGYALWRLFA